MRGFHEGKIDAEIPHPELVDKISKELTKAMGEGWPDFNKIDWDSNDFDTISRIKENMHLFSGVKSIVEMQEIRALLTTEDGKIKSYSKFKADALGVWEKYNINHLRAEYDHAIASSQMAARWSEFEINKDINPNLTYRTAGDSRVRSEHQALDGVTKAIDDSFWNTYYPPNGWGCRCDVDASDNKVSQKQIALPKLNPIFKYNVWKDGIIFPETLPYFNELKKEALNLCKINAQTKVSNEFILNAYKGKNGGKVDVSWRAERNIVKGEPELNYNMRHSIILADNGSKLKILGRIDGNGIKNPELFKDGYLSDFKQPGRNGFKNPGRGIRSAIEAANTQRCESVVLILDENHDDKSLIGNNLRRAFNVKNDVATNLNRIQEVVIIYTNKSDSVITIKQSDIATGKHWSKLL